ncbi:hypothetical protein ASPWEDRAFT_40942 [Aspergillus wentii DTO 134E9]|uniref:Uncharacterized protein n=1 Tax=Aspergillus wentii DTO 134E9 TaxID=1073089 RepID=A0A1L9RL88_ASPWE|nr:uncharacterized protein ASPWEDRAFT_40942 [Aspergillus wentii DTO 134E9]KAI9924527.1 hypothetical protein MW887_006799 [Aspergillus wentii]OJJ35706.1 hypothetical protein ASPWEDRAFT_40942 [Aspergillus wentii DTO 134E9]
MDSRLYRFLSIFTFKSNPSPSPAPSTKLTKRSLAKRKKVCFGPVVEMPEGFLSEQPTLRTINLSPAEACKPIIKPPTALDLEMFHKNLWAMVSQADQRINLNYQYYLSHGEDELLSELMMEEEQLMYSAAKQRVRQDGSSVNIELNLHVKKVSKAKKIRGTLKRSSKRSRRR